jgi:LEA14-like dessication related protein
MTKLHRFTLLVMAALLAGCAGMQSGYETPQVNITSFALSPEFTALTPRFNIGVQVINPNRNALPLRGMSYGVEIEGHRILSGATPDLPRVPGYGSADFVIEASPDLLGGMRLFSDLMAGQRQGLNYTFRARLDVGRIMPIIDVVESGQFNMPAAGQR